MNIEKLKDATAKAAKHFSVEGVVMVSAVFATLVGHPGVTFGLVVALFYMKLSMIQESLLVARPVINVHPTINVKAKQENSAEEHL